MTPKNAEELEEAYKSLVLGERLPEVYMARGNILNALRTLQNIEGSPFDPSKTYIVTLDGVREYMS